MAFVPLSAQNQSAGPEQGSEEWFAGRKYKMTGSKPSSIMFDCTDEASYNKLHAQIFGDAPRDPVDESQQAAMDWGSTKEEVACAEFINQMPGTIVFECSQIEHRTYE
jgi:predicted phage-related endonuclease